MFDEEDRVRTSSNPAFRNLPQGQGYATFGGAAAYTGTQAGPVEPGRAGAVERPITVDDVVMKTALSAGTALDLLRWRSMFAET